MANLTVNTKKYGQITPNTKPHSDPLKSISKKRLSPKLKLATDVARSSCYGILGTVFESLGQYDKAKEYLQKALVITTEVGDRKGEAADYENLGFVFKSFGQYDRAKEHLQKALVITTKIDNRKGEGIMLWKPRNCILVARAIREC